MHAVDHDIVGFVADGLERLVEAVEAVLLVDRSVCRQEAERFDSATMARRYLTAYRRLIDNPTAIANRDRLRQRIRQVSCPVPRLIAACRLDPVHGGEERTQFADVVEFKEPGHVAKPEPGFIKRRAVLAHIAFCNGALGGHHAPAILGGKCRQGQGNYENEECGDQRDRSHRFHNDSLEFRRDKGTFRREQNGSGLLSSSHSRERHASYSAALPSLSILGRLKEPSPRVPEGD